MNRQDVHRLLDAERDYQKAKWGDRQHSVPAWLLVLRQELNEAMEAWATTGDDAAAMDEVRQVAAVAIACLEQHGACVQVREWHGPKKG